MAKCLTFLGLFGMLAITIQLAAAPRSPHPALFVLKADAKAH